MCTSPCIILVFFIIFTADLCLEILCILSICLYFRCELYFLLLFCTLTYMLLVFFCLNSSDGDDNQSQFTYFSKSSSLLVQLGNRSVSEVNRFFSCSCCTWSWEQAITSGHHNIWASGKCNFTAKFKTFWFADRMNKDAVF